MFPKQLRHLKTAATMTPMEYEILRKELPGLKLPPVHRLVPKDFAKLRRMSRKRLIASRTAVLLTRDSTYDRLTPPTQGWEFNVGYPVAPL